jgi:hypothetical protein
MMAKFLDMLEVVEVEVEEVEVEEVEVEEVEVEEVEVEEVEVEEVEVVEVEVEVVEVVEEGICAVEVGKLLGFFWKQQIALKRKPSNVGGDILRMGTCMRKTRSKRIIRIHHPHPLNTFILLLVMFLWGKTHLWMTPCGNFFAQCCPRPEAACLVSLSPTNMVSPLPMK